MFFLICVNKKPLPIFLFNLGANPYNKVLIIDYCIAEPFPCPLAQSAVENIGVLSG
jgi:hypothetical protein